MNKKMDEIAGQLTPDDLFRNRQAFLAPHHRRQATTLLSQNGIDIGVTALLMLIPNE
jgi:hypothetical protein